MPTAGLATRNVWRWLAAGTFLLLSAWLSSAHAWEASHQRDALIESVVGDEAALGRRIYATTQGLAIRLDERQRTILHRELTADPMNGSAIALAALDYAARADGQRAVALTGQAIRVEPRTRLAWLVLLDRQRQRGDTAAATTSALRLLAIDSRHYANYLPVLANFARDSRTTAQIARVLQRMPIWRTRFLELLAHDGVDPAIRYALVNPPDRKVMARPADDDAAFVRDLVNKGDIERAYLAWVTLLPDTALKNGGMPYDAGFDGMPGPAPFNWQLIAAAADRAALDGGALHISYSGRSMAVLASQIVLLEANSRYSLESMLAVADPAASDGATLTWQLSCLPGRNPLARLPLAASAGKAVQRSADFTVPAERCDAAVLALIGMPGDMPTRVTAQIGAVALRRVDR